MDREQAKVLLPIIQAFSKGKTMYFVRQKKHWWSRWKLIEEDGVPRLFTSEEISKFKNLQQ